MRVNLSTTSTDSKESPDMIRTGMLVKTKVEGKTVVGLLQKISSGIARIRLNDGTEVTAAASKCVAASEADELL